MNKIYVGKIVSTHGIKGEIRILSFLDENLKDRVFKVGSHLLIDDVKYEIKSYRHHKIYEMVMFDQYHDINEVLFLLKKKVYKEKEEIILNQDEILEEDLLSFTVLTEDGKKGLIKSIEKTGKNYKILRLSIMGKEILLPYHKDFILNIDKQKKIILVKLL